MMSWNFIRKSIINYRIVVSISDSEIWHTVGWHFRLLKSLSYSVNLVDQRSGEIAHRQLHLRTTAYRQSDSAYADSLSGSVFRSCLVSSHCPKKKTDYNGHDCHSVRLGRLDVHRIDLLHLPYALQADITPY